MSFVESVAFICDLLISKEKLKLSKSALLFLVLVILQFVLSIVVNHDVSGVGEYIRLMVVYIFCFYIYTLYNTKDIIRGFCNFMCFISLVSLAFFVWVSIFPSLAFRVVNGYGTTYLTCYLSFVNLSAYNRNCGIFWEPSVFAAVCFIWGIFEICIIRNVRKRLFRISIMMLAILSTFSTSGYVYLLFLFVILLFVNNSKSYSLFKVIIAGALLAMGVLVYFNYDQVLIKLVDWLPIVFKKLLVNNSSVTDRTIGPWADMYVAVRHPFGVGITLLTPTVKRVAYEVFGTIIHTRTSTITYYCSAFGLMSGAILMISLFRFAKKATKSIFLMVVLLSGIVFMSISAPMHDSAIFILLLFLGTQRNNIESRTY